MPVTADHLAFLAVGVVAGLFASWLYQRRRDEEPLPSLFETVPAEDSQLFMGPLTPKAKRRSRVVAAAPRLTVGSSGGGGGGSSDARRSSAVGNRAVVIGGGPSGLSAALALKRAGWSTHIVEADPYTEGQQKGFGWLIMPNGVQALDQLGAKEGVVTQLTAIRAAELHYHDGTTDSVEMSEDTYCSSRTDIIKALLGCLDVGQLEPTRLQSVALTDTGEGRAVDALQLKKDGGMVTLRAGVDFDLVVGADGVHSRLAKALNPDLDRTSHGRCHTLITAADDADFAGEMKGRFTKVYFAAKRQCAAFGLVGVSGARVVGFLQYDTVVHGEAPHGHGSTQADMVAFIRTVLQLEDGSSPSDPVHVALIRRFLRCAVNSGQVAHVWRPAPPGMVPQVHCVNAVLIGDAAHAMADFTSQALSHCPFLLMCHNAPRGQWVMTIALSDRGGCVR